MQTRTYSETRRRDPELWTCEDARAWREAEFVGNAEVWIDEDPLLDNDLWMEDDFSVTLSPSGLVRLGIRAS